jgi:hypothetical protein
MAIAGWFCRSAARGNDGEDRRRYAGNDPHFGRSRVRSGRVSWPISGAERRRGSPFGGRRFGSNGQRCTPNSQRRHIGCVNGDKVAENEWQCPNLRDFVSVQPPDAHHISPGSDDHSTRRWREHAAPIAPRCSPPPSGGRVVEGLSGEGGGLATDVRGRRQGPPRDAAIGTGRNGSGVCTQRPTRPGRAMAQEHQRNLRFPQGCVSQRRQIPR